MNTSRQKGGRTLNQPGGTAESHPTSPLPPGVRSGQGLGPAERVRSRGDHARLRKRGRRGGDAVLRVLVGPNGLGWSRIGLAVPRRYGKAVRRNRLRRLVKEAFRAIKGELPPGYDIVVSPARGLATPTLEAVRESLRALVTKTARRLEQKQQARKP